ncbi:MAG: DUF547 domain-containing protein [Planctomycetota bacterium]|jgi:hypothetical protein
MRVVLLLLAGCAQTIVVEGEPDRFAYEPWANVLGHVENGKVDYEAIPRTELNRFVAMLARFGPQTTPELFPTEPDRLAYWINAYNAVVIHQVLERWPIESVGKKKAQFFYWTRYVVDGKPRSLYAIENDIIRKRFDEPRIHFALNCASTSCPRLPSEPFVPAKLENQLKRETDRFLAEHVSLEGETLYLSKIFEWYAEDFGPDPATWVGHPGKKVVYRPYDWSLNSNYVGK